MWVPPFCCPATARLFPTKSGKWTPSRWSLQEVRKENSEEEEGFHTGEQARVTLAACGVCEARDWGRKAVGWTARQAGANRLLESRQIKALASGSDSGDLGRSDGRLQGKGHKDETCTRWLPPGPGPGLGGRRGGPSSECVREPQASASSSPSFPLWPWGPEGKGNPWLASVSSHHPTGMGCEWGTPPLHSR